MPPKRQLGLFLPSSEGEYQPGPAAAGRLWPKVVAGTCSRILLVRVWELEGSSLLAMGELGVLPLVAAARSSREEVLEAERRLVEGALDRGVKADLLTVLTIFAGFKDRGLVEELLRRRRDLMVESVAYELIKEEGIREGMEKGMEKGSETRLREDVLEALAVRFGRVPVEVEEQVVRIRGRRTLEELHRKAILVESLEAFGEVLSSGG